MVVVRFSVLFDKIRNGLKKQTIRPAWTYEHLKVSDWVHCYSTKKVEGVHRPVVDELLYKGVCVEILRKRWEEIKEDERVAELDGFKDAKEMREWFQTKYPKLSDLMVFKIIRWT